MIWFEVDDVVRYFLTARQPTGIQRVVSEILAAGIGEAGELRGRFALCRFRASNGRLEPIPAAEFARISAGARRALRTGSRASAWQRAHALLHHGVFVAANVLRARLRDLFASRDFEGIDATRNDALAGTRVRLFEVLDFDHRSASSRHRCTSSDV